MRHFLLLPLLGLAIAIPCQAGIFNHACPQCGCCQLKKVCRLVPEVKKVPEVSYTVEEEEACALGKSQVEERMVCDGCSPTGQRCEKVVTPRCGRIICKKKLKKTTTMVDKQTYKCVIDTCCTGCGCTCDSRSCTP